MKNEIRKIVNSLLRTQRAYIETEMFLYSANSSIMSETITKEGGQLIFDEYKRIGDKKNKLQKEYELRYNKFIDILYINE